jgi:hypothetical protein
MNPQSTIFAPEMIACIAEGREPTIDELFRVADRIGADLRGTRSAFAWGELKGDNSERLLTLRAAMTALTGDGAAGSTRTGSDKRKAAPFGTAFPLSAERGRIRRV